MNIQEVLTDIFDNTSKPAEIYTHNKKGLQKFVGKVFIKPFHAEMKNNVNNIILFIDDQENITGGQIGKYDIENGLRVVMF